MSFGLPRPLRTASELTNWFARRKKYARCDYTNVTCTQLCKKAQKHQNTFSFFPIGINLYMLRATQPNWFFYVLTIIQKTPILVDLSSGEFHLHVLPYNDGGVAEMPTAPPMGMSRCFLGLSGAGFISSMLRRGAIYRYV